MKQREEDRLCISAIDSQNSILLSSYLPLSPTCNIPCAALVDSGCTGEAFFDYAFAQRNNIPLLRLPFPRPLHLADGSMKDLIREYTILPFQVGNHSELLSFFVAELAAEHPVILGIPWLAKHSPNINWIDRSLTFDKCLDNCFPHGRALLPAPTIRKPSSNYKPPTVEDAEEEDEAYPELDDQGEVIPEETPEHDDQGEVILEETPEHDDQGEVILEETPEHDDQGEVLLEEIQTPTPDDTLEYWSEYRKTWEQALQRTERRRVQRQRRRSRSPRQLVDPATLRKPTVKMTGGRRVVTQPHRNPMAGRIHSARRLKADSTPIDTSDIKLLNAANFILLARQRGVTIMRTTMGELEEAVKEQHTIHMK